MITNPRVVAQLGPQKFNTAPVGAGVGPYELVRYTPGVEIVMKAKDDYWGGPVCIKQLRFVTIPNKPVDAFDRNETNMVFTLSARDIAQLRGEKVPTYTELSNLGQMVRINDGFGNPPTKDVRIRQAVQYALDPKVIDQRVNNGTGKPTTSIIDKDSPLYPGVAGPPYDPAKALQLVKDAKAGGWDGKIELITSNTQDAVETSLTIEAMLQAVGFDVVLNNSFSPNDFINRMIRDHNFQLGISGLNLYNPSPATSLEKFFGTGNTFNGYSNPAWDALMKELRAAPDLATQRKVLAKVQQLWNQDIPGAIYGAAEYVIGYKSNIHGLVFTSDTSVLFSKAYIS